MAKKLILFSNCKISKGIKQSVVCDLHKNCIVKIPNSLADILLKYNKCNLDEIYSDFSEEEGLILDEYFDFLIKLKLIFVHDEIDTSCFPYLDTSFEQPYQISNCIIDLNQKSTVNYDLVEQLNNFNCKYIQIRIYDIIGIQNLDKLIRLFDNTTIHQISLIIPYELYKMPAFKANLLSEKYPRVSDVFVYNSNDNDTTFTEKLFTPIRFVTKNILSEKNCGFISQTNFAINLPHYTESIHHNTCLNGKIAIDAEGNIKNCPSMKESFGNIKDTTLEEAINKPGFKKYWNITKDQITKCKDCEFRHVCTDCRAYIDNPNDIYSAPLKCGYDPYTCTWEEWSTNPLKQKAIDYYGMREILTSENEI